MIVYVLLLLLLLLLSLYSRAAGRGTPSAAAPARHGAELGGHGLPEAGGFSYSNEVVKNIDNQLII